MDSACEIIKTGVDIALGGLAAWGIYKAFDFSRKQHIVFVLGEQPLALTARRHKICGPTASSLTFL